MESQTFIYKTVGLLQVKLDLYLPPAASNVPIVLWFHGGGLLQGSRAKVAPHFLSSVTKYNHALISADYRLAPQVNVSDVLQDVIDCLSFIHHDLPKQLQAPNSGGKTIDPSRLAISGSSAGGYLALLAGLHAPTTLTPKVILAIYPITNPLGVFFTTPQSPPEHIDRATVAPYLDPTADAVADNDPQTRRQKMYYYMMQSANLAELLGLVAPKTNNAHGGGSASVVVDNPDKYLVAKHILHTHRMPVPCYMVHGDADRFVGVDQADEVFDALQKIGKTTSGKDADVLYERLPGLDHVFDQDESYRMETMYGFMQRFL